jgi:carboxypeptidase C (cathepsin A)
LRLSLFLVALVLSVGAGPRATAQGAPPAPPSTPATAPGKEAAKPATDDEKPTVTQHTIQIHGMALHYSAAVGKLPLKNATSGEVEANVYYIAYTVPTAPGAGPRPLIFAYNGGPGASSIYVHVGGIGPRRVKMQPEGFMPAPPYQMVDNEETLLDRADLVFIDPVGSGFSRATKPELSKKYWGIHGDLDEFGEFIRLYLTRNDRWNSPLFLLGESYGTMRSAGLSNHLFEMGIALNGIVLVSSVLNLSTIVPSNDNDLPYAYLVPSYTAIAWYHKKLPPDLQQDRAKALAESQRWAMGEYLQALAAGDHMSAKEREGIVEKLARYTGLSRHYVDESNLRIYVPQFCKELLHDQHRSVGRYDGRFTGIEPHSVSPFPDFDPSDAATGPPFVSAFSQYLRTELGYRTDTVYVPLSGEANRSWDWETRGFGFGDLSDDLRSAFAKNPYMKLFLAEGYYDLATPFTEADYTLDHLDLDPKARKEIRTERYESGHMIYLNTSARAKLQTEVEQFIEGAVPKG